MTSHFHLYRGEPLRLRPRGVKGTLWLDCYVGKRRVRESLHTSCPVEGLQRAQRILDRRLDTSTGDTWNLAEAVERTVATRWAGSRGAHTAETNAGTAVEYFGAAARLDSINTDALDGYVAFLRRQGLADGTVRRKLAALSTVLTTAVERDKLARKPRFPRIRTTQGRVRYLTEAEEGTLLTFAHNNETGEFHSLLVVLLDTGLRLGEALRLQRRDVENTAVTVWESKGDTRRTIPLTKRALDAVADRLAGPPTGRVFAGLTKGRVERAWARCRAALGVAEDPQFVVHALRHTCASRLVQRGVPLRVVQEWMGHRAIQTTLIYAHLAPANLEQARRALEGTPSVSPLRRADQSAA